MKLEVGQAVKLIKKGGSGKSNQVKEYVGKINKIYPTFLLLRLKEYNECILIADILDRKNYNLKVKKGKGWIETNIDMLDGGNYNA